MPLFLWWTDLPPALPICKCYKSRHDGPLLGNYSHSLRRPRIKNRIRIKHETTVVRETDLKGGIEGHGRRTEGLKGFVLGNEGAKQRPYPRVNKEATGKEVNICLKYRSRGTYRGTSTIPVPSGDTGVVVPVPCRVVFVSLRQLQSLPGPSTVQGYRSPTDRWPRPVLSDDPSPSLRSRSKIKTEDKRNTETCSTVGRDPESTG